MIKIQNLSFSYSKEEIFKNFSCEFHCGERVCISGVSGKGKTTLLRLITGLEKNFTGSIKKQDKLKLSVVFQNDVLLPWYTALENVKIVSDENKARLFLDKLGLNDSYDKYPAQLSGGMQRRVAIARAMAYDSDVIILDEAFKGLDEKLKKEVMSLLIEKYSQKLIIFTSHEKLEQDFLATRIIEL